MRDGDDGLDVARPRGQRGAQRHGLGTQGDAADVRLDVHAAEHAPVAHPHRRSDVVAAGLVVVADVVATSASSSAVNGLVRRDIGQIGDRGATTPWAVKSAAVAPISGAA
jgi:hypothetical protein